MNTNFIGQPVLDDDAELWKKGIVPDGGMVRVTMALMDSGQRAIAQHKRSQTVSDNGYSESVKMLADPSYNPAAPTHTTDQSLQDNGYSESVRMLNDPSYNPGGHTHTADQSPDNGYAESVAALQYRGGNTV